MSGCDARASEGSWSAVNESSLSQHFPVHRACRDGEVGVLRDLLLQETTRFHLALEDTHYGWTPTHWAAYFGKVDCLQVLITGVGNGVTAQVGLATSRFSQTPAHIAAFAGHPHCLTFLLHAGLDPSAQDYLGETSLHKAARTGSTECAAILISNRASVGSKNNNGQTAAQLANACGHTALANQLLQTEREQGGSEGPTGGIVRSIPAHGLNGGVFPVSPTTPSPLQPPTSGVCTSSNGYYGYQPTTSTTQPQSPTTSHHNGASNGHTQPSEDMDMETDAPASADVQNGHSNLLTNGTNGTKPNGDTTGNGVEGGLRNGFTTNGTAPQPPPTLPNGLTNGITNGSSCQVGPVPHLSVKNVALKVPNGVAQDITINAGVSSNHIPVAGCKRSREEGSVPDMKRMRMEEVSPPNHRGGGVQAWRSWPQASLPLPHQSSSSLLDHVSTIKAENGYESANYEVLMAEMHGC